MLYTVLFLAGAALQAYFIVQEHRERYVSAVILKGSASLFFVLTGLLASGKCSEPGFARTILIGLVFGMAGDILLNLRFVFPENGQKIFLVGIVAFLIGHILYLAALIPLSSNLAACVAIGAVLASLLLYRIFTTMEVKPAFKVFGVVYLGAVIIMTTVAIGNLLSSFSTTALVYAVGAVLFTVSDIVLIFNTFGSTSRFSMRIANLSLYYAGQMLIALSLLFR